MDIDLPDHFDHNRCQQAFAEVTRMMKEKHPRSLKLIDLDLANQRLILKPNIRAYLALSFLLTVVIVVAGTLMQTWLVPIAILPIVWVIPLAGALFSHHALRLEVQNCIDQLET